MQIPITIQNLEDLAAWMEEAKPSKIIIHHEHPLLNTQPFKGQKDLGQRPWTRFNSVPIEYV